jgi:hypothetical protein
VAREAVSFLSLAPAGALSGRLSGGGAVGDPLDGGIDLLDPL